MFKNKGPCSVIFRFQASVSQQSRVFLMMVLWRCRDHHLHHKMVSQCLPEFPGDSPLKKKSLLESKPTTLGGGDISEQSLLSQILKHLSISQLRVLQGTNKHTSTTIQYPLLVGTVEGHLRPAKGIITLRHF